MTNSQTNWWTDNLSGPPRCHASGSHTPPAVWKSSPRWRRRWRERRLRFLPCYIPPFPGDRSICDSCYCSFYFYFPHLDFSSCFRYFLLFFNAFPIILLPLPPTCRVLIKWPMVILEGMAWGLMMMSGVIPSDVNSMSSSRYWMPQVPCTFQWNTP